VLLDEQITGAPVVDEGGECLGVLSASDIARAEATVVQERRTLAESSFWSSSLVLPSSVYEQKLSEVRDKITPAAEQPIRRFMTTDLVAVREDTPLRKVVADMIDAHVHRVLVLDANQRLAGIISTTDVLSALLRVSREADLS
jgi:CBS domain-containing protein